MAERVHDDLGKPGGFAVFVGTMSVDDQDGNSFALYFSPVAAAHCMESLIPLGAAACERPSRGEPGFGLAFGEGSPSWDLLD
jgi:hypothetical protein